MKIERLSQDKIRIFLTYDDLSERGIQKDDMWREIPKVHELFSEMMDQAHTELGFDASGPLAVEVFGLPVQGMIVIVTRGDVEHHSHATSFEEMDDEEIYEIEVTLEQSDLISYAFSDFEHLLDAAKMVRGLSIGGGKLFHYRERWILQLEPGEMVDGKLQALIAVLSEFGEVTSVTSAMLEEYGKFVMASDAIETLCSHFR